MAALESDGGEIHSPERWAVLEEALRELNAEGFRATDETTAEEALGDMQEDTQRGCDEKGSARLGVSREA